MACSQRCGRHIRRCAVRAIAFSLSGAFVGSSGEAQVATSPAVAIPPIDRQSVRIPLEVPLTANGKFLGTISVAVDARGNGEIAAVRLVELLASMMSGATKATLLARTAGREQIDFTDLQFDGFAIAFDSLALGVVVTLRADASATSSVALTERASIPDPAQFAQPERFAAGLNIAATQRFIHGPGGGFGPVQGDLGAIVNIGGFNGVTITGGAAYDGERWERHEIRATHDLYTSALRATIGEFTPVATAFQGSGRVLGFGLERAYATIRPFQNVRPVGQRAFQLDRDANVEVFVNDVRVQTVRLAAGRYDLTDFPVATGANRVRLVVDDIGGRREIVSFGIFSSGSLLAKGITEFGGAIGLRETTRLHYALSPAATGYALRGISDTLTLGINAQATSRAAQLGALAIYGSPLGLFQFDGAVSKASGDSAFGVAATIQYRGVFSLLDRADLRIDVAGTYRSARFTDAFSVAAANQQAFEGAVLVQWQAPFGLSTSAGFTRTIFRAPTQTVNRYDISIGRSFGRIGVNCSASQTRYSDGRPTDRRFAIGITLRLDNRHFASARYDSGGDRKEATFSRASNGTLDDISGELRLTDDRITRALSGRVAYINNRFDLVVNHNRLTNKDIGGQSSVSSDWNLRTFIGFTGGTLAIGRTANDGFVVAPLHRSLAGAQARIMAGGRVIARSGIFGPALMPIDRAYGVVRREVTVDPLPLGYDFDGLVNAFPGYGTGYKLMIGSDAWHIAVGYLKTAQGPVELAAGTITSLVTSKVRAAPASIFTNRAGRFVADHLTPGRYRVTVSTGSAEFVVPDSKEGLTDVGTLTILP